MAMAWNWGVVTAYTCMSVGTTMAVRKMMLTLPLSLCSLQSFLHCHILIPRDGVSYVIASIGEMMVQSIKPLAVSLMI